MKNCCFCISLRTATLILSILGAASHFYSGVTLSTMSFEEFDRGTVFGLTLYSYISGWACLAGAVGVVKNNVRRLRLFNIYYWADLALHAGFSVASAVMLFTLHSDICEEMSKAGKVELETCEQVYIQSAWIVTIAMALSMLLKLHFAFAIHSYTKRVQQEQQHGESTLLVVEYTPVPPMDTKEQTDVIYVAGKEFIPDDKKQQV